MTSILEEKHAKFRFYDSFNKVEDEYCDIIVNVKKFNIQMVKSILM